MAKKKEKEALKRYIIVSMYSCTQFLPENVPTQNVHQLVLTMVSIYLVLIMVLRVLETLFYLTLMTTIRRRLHYAHFIDEITKN